MQINKLLHIRKFALILCDLLSWKIANLLLGIKICSKRLKEGMVLKYHHYVMQLTEMFVKTKNSEFKVNFLLTGHHTQTH